MMGDDRYQILIVSTSAAADEMKARLAESDFTSVKITDYQTALDSIRDALPDLILLTNSPKPKVVGLDAYGLEIVGTRRVSEAG